MNIVEDYPPNYQSIVKAIPAVRGFKGAVFTYGDTIYNPSGQRIPMDLIAHEEEHIRQQEMAGDPTVWWTAYLKDPDFRANQEVGAYVCQYDFARAAYQRSARRELLIRISRDLASPLYGSVVDKHRARRLITKEEKWT